MDEDKSSDKVEYVFDLDSMELSDTIVDAHQEGNYIVATTDKGITFRQRVAYDKILSKNSKGDYILLSMKTL